MKQFIKDLFSNPDGSGSTKRTAGWVTLWAVLILIFGFPTHEQFQFAVGGLLTFASGLFGLSSWDYQTYKKNNNENKVV
jgi:hypothetical protein